MRGQSIPVWNFLRGEGSATWPCSLSDPCLTLHTHLEPSASSVPQSEDEPPGQSSQELVDELSQDTSFHSTTSRNLMGPPPVPGPSYMRNLSGEKSRGHHGARPSDLGMYISLLRGQPQTCPTKEVLSGQREQDAPAPAPTTTRNDPRRRRKSVYSSTPLVLRRIQ